MGDFENAVAHAREAQSAGREISDACARVIASMYHGGFTGPLRSSHGYSFVSTGTIPEPADALWLELFGPYDKLRSDDERLLFGMFGTYALNRPDREVGVPGWSSLWLDSECRHSWVAGMMHVHDEDLETVAAMRQVECEKCEAVYGS